MKSKTKTNKELLASYMRSNKVRRERIATKNGFKNGDAYKLHLLEAIIREGEVSKKTTKKETKIKAKRGVDGLTPAIHNVHILDVSYSMTGGKLRNAVKGINSEISELKKDDNATYLQTIVTFSGSEKEYKMNVKRKPIHNVPVFKASTKGMTALYEAIGTTLEWIESYSNLGEKTIVKIFTDGGENASQGKYRAASAVRERIELSEAQGVTIAFVGTTGDIRDIVQNVGVRHSNTYAHDNTAHGVEMSFQVSTQATKAYAGKVSRGEAVLDGFYKEAGTLD